MTNAPYVARSIADLHRLFFLPAPKHDLITVFDLTNRQCLAHASSSSLVFDFYSIWYKENAGGTLGYGQRAFDFNTGSLTFQAPGQLITVEDHYFSAGWALAFHPDLFRQYSLVQSIKDFDFFSYEVYRALQLTPENEESVNLLVSDIGKETQLGKNSFGEPIIVAQLELLLRMINRFYHNQSSPEQSSGSDLLTAVENEIQKYFNHDAKDLRPLLTVKYLADQLNLTPHHLSEKLKELTGSSALQHIHFNMVEKAKELISISGLTISEVAYVLGFEYPQSFSKVFKNKTGFTPTAFKNSLCTKRSVSLSRKN
ncbi:helix-turn-helix domain-containing protein [Flavobacterium sp. N1736]|uniref:helix-turn-helix domain-containing protein n=1 Tax=Flavobacterium sp. N1736 TaxID=2986823 RepID=UPI002223F535|nr:response regulator transcription factor [Flavobacterium sp. N1736]